MKSDEKYYNFQDILKFLSFDYEFDKKNKEYPFNRGKGNVYFSWGQIIIPKYGILEMVKNKISDIKEQPISEIKMIYNIPFYENVNEEVKCGVISKNITVCIQADWSKYIKNHINSD